MLLAAASAVLFAWKLSAPVETVAGRFCLDDTFYYLELAWNRIRLGFATFDGVHPTNGVQLLWYETLLPLSALASSRDGLLAGALRLSAALGVAAVPLAYAAGRAVRDRRVGIGAALVACWLGQREALVLSGLETALYLVVVLFAMALYFRVLREPEPGALVALAGALAIAHFARIDAVLWTAPLAAHAAVETARARRRRGLDPWRPPGIALLLGLAAGGAELLAFRTMGGRGGTWLPVSALWKHWWRVSGSSPHFAWPSLPPLASLAAVVGQVEELLGLTLAGPRLGFEILALALVVLVALEIAGSPRRGGTVDVAAASTADARRRRGLAVAAGAIALHTAAVAIFADHPWPWYFVPLWAAIVLGAGLLLGHLPAASAGARWRPSPWQAGVGLAAVALAATLALDFGAGAARMPTLTASRIALAHELATRLPAGTRVGALNSGELGYFSGLPVTNLDGLVNSGDYYRYRRGGGSLVDYLHAEGIGWYVDYNVPAEVAAHSELVFTVRAPALAGVLGGRPPLIEGRRVE